MSSSKSSVLPASLSSLIYVLETEKPNKPSQLRTILLESKVTEEELLPYAHFDHAQEDSYGRKMIYDGGAFEIMVMSWNPGDLSAIHDHGYTQWGAVKVFGEAEHAAFIIRDQTISTLNRTMFKPGQVLGVGHDMVHQMGCPLSGERFISLHVYGNNERTSQITEDTRLYHLAHDHIKIMNGGAFFNVPAENVVKTKEAPEADFATLLRDRVETMRSKRKIKADFSDVQNQTYALKGVNHLLSDLEEMLDEKGHHIDSNFWCHLTWELKEAAALQQELYTNNDDESDHFDTYAALYDAVIGKPCLDNFMADYLKFFVEKFVPDLKEKTVLSLGCGTGLVEEFIIQEFDLPKANLLGFDISPAMVNVASQRINAETGDALQLDPEIQTWDLAYSGLNVLQYIGHTNMEKVIESVASILKPGGYFLGDFITPDHIRWYPNVLWSADRKIVSLRTPCLIERNQHTYQQSHIINVDASGDHLRITDEGLHDRFLPPLHRIRHYFEKAFESVELFDAVHLTPISVEADTCPSTRYIVVAKKGR